MNERKERKHLKVLIPVLAMALGLSLLFCSGYLILGNYLEDQKAGTYARDVDQILDDRIDDSPMAAYLSNPEFIPDYKIDPEMPMPVCSVDGLDYIGQLAIPALDLELAVQSELSYPGLKKSPCRYTGSAYLSNMTIAAHNYKTHFGRLKNLETGDAVNFTDMDGNLFQYQVMKLDEIDPRPVEQVTESGHDLVLFTCTLGGATRVAVYCDLI